jgi:hypothetical protein
MENVLPTNRADYRKSSRLIYSFTILLALVVLAALALYVVRFVTAVQPGVSHDDAEYLVLAESFATGRPYRLINFPQQPFETVWPPGYPLFILAPAWLVIGPNYDLLRMTSLILAIVNIGLVYKLFRPLLSPPLLILVVALFAFNQAVAGAAGLTMSETAFFFFSLLSVILFSIWKEKPGILNLAIFAIGLHPVCCCSGPLCRRDSGCGSLYLPGCRTQIRAGSCFNAQRFCPLVAIWLVLISLGYKRSKIDECCYHDYLAIIQSG